MRLSNEDLYQLLEARREQLGLSQTEVSNRATGRAGNSAFQSIRRGASPSIQRVAALCEALGLELYIGLPRPALSSHERLAMLAAEKDYSLVPFHADEDNDPPIAFRNEWLAALNLRLGQCSVVNIRDNAMAPTLECGDLALLDHTRTDLTSGRMYGIVEADGAVSVRRLEKSGDHLLLRPDNPSAPARVVQIDQPDMISIIGRVAWSGHEWPT